MTLEEQSMKKSFGKKLLVGIVSASMILGIPVAGYSQEEDLSQLVIAQEETAEVTEEVLAGAGEVEVAAVETPADVAAVEETEVFSEVVAEVQEDLAEDAPAEEEEEFLIADDEEPEDSEEIPEDGILLETETEEEEETLEAADGAITPVGTITEFEEAILQAKEGDTIRLTADMSYLGSNFHINKNTLKDATSVTIDLNKKTLTFGSSFWFYVEDGKKLTITNGTLQGSLNVQGAEVNISSDATVTESICVRISDGGVVNVNGGSLVSSGGTSTVAVDVYDGTLNMNKDSLLEVKDDSRTGILINKSAGAVNLTDANINVTGDGDGVMVNGGAFEIKKGELCTKIETKGNAVTLGNNSGQTAKIIINGTQDTTKIISETGYAIYEKDSDSYGSIEVYGGYLEGKTADIYSKNKEKIVKVTTEDVGFDHPVNRIYLPNVNCRADRKNANGVYIIRTLTAENAAAAYIRDGVTFYTDTLKEAMTVTSESYSPNTGDTVKLFKDITPETTDEDVIKIGINRTIDLNNHLVRTRFEVKGCIVTFKNGTMKPYTNDYVLVVDEGADVTLDSSVTVSSSEDSTAIKVGGDAAATYKLTVKSPVTAKYYALDVIKGKSTIVLDSAKLTATDSYTGSTVWVSSEAKDAKITVNKCTITGPQGMKIFAGECTITDSVIAGNGDQTGDPSPGTTSNGSAITFAKDATLTIKSGTFTSEKGHALYIQDDATGSVISGGTFRSKRSNWDAVSGKKATNMITGGTYSPNKTNMMKDSVDTSKVALVGETDGIFYAEAYDKVMPTLYAGNASATKFTVGAAASGKTITGCQAHTEFLNKSGADVSLLIGTDATVAKNKGTLPSSATTVPWIFHNDLVKLTAAANKEATCTLPGVTADCWYCETLKKAYKTADAKEEVDPGTITAAAKGHTWGEWDANGDRVCTVCGEKQHDDSKVQPAYQISGRPAKVSAKAVGGRKLTVSWKKPASSKLKKIKGFYIEVATDKNFTNIVRHRKVGKTKTSYTFKKLKKGTRYYVRVRFYKGSKISKWSAVKYRKVK